MVEHGHRPIIMLLYSSSQRTQNQINSIRHSILKKRDSENLRNRKARNKMECDEPTKQTAGPIALGA